MDMGLNKFRYSLDEGSRKFNCPSCNKKRFVKYVECESGEYLPDDIGRCDREQKCGYHKAPERGNGMVYNRYSNSSPKPLPPLKDFTLSDVYLKKSLRNYEANTLIQWIASLPGWDIDRAISVARLYNIGTSKEGWAIFWQVDEAQKVRSGKMMKYSKSGRRVKEGYSQDWVHSKLKRKGHLKSFELVQCFFGLHLLSDKPVAIVESEKTAIIASQYLPQFTWMASGQLNGINEYKISPLRGRNIVLFPDIGCYHEWNTKALDLSKIANITVSALLENKASEEDDGYDLADYLIRFNLKSFKSGKSGKSEAKTKHIFFNADAPHGFNPWTAEVFDERGYPAEWDNINTN